VSAVFGCLHFSLMKTMSCQRKHFHVIHYNSETYK